MKLLFENWRRYLQEIERPGPGRTKSRYERMAEPIAFDGFAKATYDATGESGGFLEENDSKLILNNKKEVIDYIKDNPNEKIYLDNPKGSKKGFGGTKEVELPFDYGEWSNLINPADDMGWDLIIVPSSTKDSENLIPIGHADYTEEIEKKGNDKIIIASNGVYTDKDKETIDNFFDKIDLFKKVKWL